MQKTVEETYQKVSQLQHILKRPDSYVGSNQFQRSKMWVLPSNALQFELKEIEYVPALFKIFDEVLVNASDNYQRSKESKKKMTELNVEINQEEGYISVMNNGEGIPVQMHKTEKMYVPELIFGHLLTGSNYDDDEKKVVGGRNGFGAKLANIYSKKFIVECCDGKSKKKFRMTWQNNMTLRNEPEITPYKGNDTTFIKFYPQFKRFNGMKSFDEDIVSLLRKRVYDMAGILDGVKVTLNRGSQINVNSFNKYVDMYFKEDVEAVKLRNQANDRWKVVVSLSDGEFKHASFVNGICTSKGGKHIDYLVDQIVQKIQAKMKNREKGLQVKKVHIKNQLWLFVDCLIQNPIFDSQTKQNMTSKISKFGSTCQLSEKLIKDLLKTNILDRISTIAKANQFKNLAKGAGKKISKLTGVPKLEDANDAGTRNSHHCTLILTEGDSAKSLAMAGLEVIGRDRYGVFPLKGKLLNVREAPLKKIKENDEIQNLIKIVGLDPKIQYNQQSIKKLRYGSIMIMADQDTDGSHIKGLVINFVHHFWPSLFKINGFLKQFVTPLLKVSKGRQVYSFYTMREYKVWTESVPTLKGWKIKYYKGLGTSTDKQAQQYFENLQRNKIDFTYDGLVDDESIEKVFSKANIENRKIWLSTYDPQVVMEYFPPIHYKDFVDKQLIHFSNEDNQRSIASIMDGLKPGQRKIIYSCFKRNLKDEIKVAQLGGYVAEHSAYHHGEMSLTMSIVNMAQNFVGSNNINLLMPNGQFGSRNGGGKDHASARYIFTNLNKITRLLYNQADDHTLKYEEDDGQLVEPIYYMPIIPMGLVNGCQGIGSGWSTSIPNFNPKDIANMLIKKLEKNQPFDILHPWYKGFMGEIVKVQGKNKYQVKGVLEIDEERENIIHIKELPIGKWTKDYKVWLDEIMAKGDERIVGLREYHTKNRVHFQLELNQKFYQDNNHDELFKYFKLSSSISMNNMVGFNDSRKLRKYDSSSIILQEFFDIRLSYYIKRKEYLLSKIIRDLSILQNKERFILEVANEKLIIRNTKKVKLVQLLKQRGYTKHSKFPIIKTTKKIVEKGEKKNPESQGQQNQNQNEEEDESRQYNYLLSMPLWNITYEKVEQIKRQREIKSKQLKSLEETSVESLWLTDLRQFLQVLDKIEVEEDKERLKGESKIKRADKAQKAKRKGGQKKLNVKKQKVTYNDFESSDGQFQTRVPEGKKGAKKKGKGRAKNESDDDSFLKKSKVSVEKSKPKAKKQGKKEEKKSEQEYEGILQRVKRKMKQQKQQNKIEGSTISAKTIVSNKPSNTDSDNFVVVNVPSLGKSSKKKKKIMNLDSDEEQSQEYEGGSDSD